MKKLLCVLFGLVTFGCVPVSADPIIVGPDSYMTIQEVGAGLEWESNQHLRVAFFHDDAPGDQPTTYQAEQRITETVLGDVYWYFLPLAGIDPCGRSQADLESQPGSGVHVLIDALLFCPGTPPAVQPFMPPSPVVDISQPYAPGPSPDEPIDEPIFVPEHHHDMPPPMPEPVPEPATVGLVAFGLAAIAKRSFK